MIKRISEKQLLKKLNIPDWRHMSKDKLTTFISSLPYLDPEVAKAAINQFPNFSEFVKDMIKVMQENADKSINSDEKTSLASIDFLQQTRDTLFLQLDSEELSENERLRILDGILELNKMTLELNKQRQNFLLKNSAIIATTIGTLALTAVSILGVNHQTKGVEFDENDFDDE